MVVGLPLPACMRDEMGNPCRVEYHGSMPISSNFSSDRCLCKPAQKVAPVAYQRSMDDSSGMTVGWRNGWAARTLKPLDSDPKPQSYPDPLM